MIDRSYFFAHVRSTLFKRSMSQAQINGCTAILDGWDKWESSIASRYFIAYSLATTYFETEETMTPVREAGEGRGRPYGKAAGPWHCVYYGRGDVQLTWQDNYAEATRRLKIFNVLGPDDDLVKDPDLALRPDIAAAILIFGMVNGWFTEKRLGDYFTEHLVDWMNARRIINGTDHAAEIAGYGRDFYLGLQVAVR